MLISVWNENEWKSISCFQFVRSLRMVWLHSCIDKISLDKRKIELFLPKIGNKLSSLILISKPVIFRGSTDVKHWCVCRWLLFGQVSNDHLSRYRYYRTLNMWLRYYMTPNINFVKIGPETLWLHFS